MTALIAWLVRRGLSEAVATKAAPWLAALALCALAVAAGATWLHFHDRGVVKHATDRANVTELQHQVAADSSAADQRMKDATAQRDQQEAYHDAIHAPAPGDAGDPDVRLACEQLRRSGQDTTGLPACGGR